MVNRNPVIKHTKIFINNEFVDAASGKTFPSINPATEKVVGNVAEGDKVLMKNIFFLVQLLIKQLNINYLSSIVNVAHV